MLAEFTVKNYYSIRSEQSLSFIPSTERKPDEEFLHEVKPGVNLLKMGIIYGANASGKTNILRALDDFRYLQVSIPEDKLSGVPFIPFMLDDNSRKEPTSMKMTFYVSGVCYELFLEYDNEKIFKEHLLIGESSRMALGYKRTYDAAQDRPIIEFGTKIKLIKKSQQAIISNTINNCTVLAAFGKTNVEPSRLDEVFEFFTKSMKGVLQPNMILSSFIKSSLRKDDSGKLKAFLLKMLKLSDFNIVNMSVHEEEDQLTPEMQRIMEADLIQVENKEETLKRGTFKHDELSFEHQSDTGIFSLPEALESIGTIRFMGMSVLLSKLLLTNSFVSIDEIESSIHYELVSYFLKVFLANSDKDSQLLITTHDLNLMNEDFLRRDVMWSADKIDSGETIINRFSDMGLHKSMSVYNAYRQGKLGKLPFLGSIYLDIDDTEEK